MEPDAGRADAQPSMDAEADDAAMRDARQRPVEAGTGEMTVVYAHSRDTLFSFSPQSQQVTEIGRFQFPDGSDAPFMLDLAVDSEGNVYTSSDAALFEVDPETAEVEMVGEFDLEGDQLFALSFLHEGAYRAGEETLIGAANSGTYHRIDPQSAQTDYLGQYPDGWKSSGDIVSVEELGTFATARRDDYESDVLLEIDFGRDGSTRVEVKGAIEQGDEGFVDLFGLGFWGRKLYGFSNSGQLIAIDRGSGDGELLSTETGSDQYWGAGVTTQAPVLF
jgi:hypothetical protein